MKGVEPSYSVPQTDVLTVELHTPNILEYYITTSVISQYLLYETLLVTSLHITFDSPT